MFGAAVVGRTQDATLTMSQILKRYAELSTYGEKLRQILAAGGQVPCEIWNAYNQACTDYLRKSQGVFDQLTQKGIAVDQVVYSGGQPVPDPQEPGSYRTVRVNAPLRPPAFGFTSASCPGIATFQDAGNFQSGTTGWVPVPVDADLGSITAAAFTAMGTGVLFVLTGGSAPIGAAAYASYKTYQTVSVWLEDYFDPPVRILQAYTDCVTKTTAAGLSAAQASQRCTAAQTSAQQYAQEKAKAGEWGFWSWVGVGTAVLVTGGVLALYLRGRVSRAAGVARAALMGYDDGAELGCGCSFGRGSRRSRRRSRAMLLGY